MALSSGSANVTLNTEQASCQNATETAADKNPASRLPRQTDELDRQVAATGAPPGGRSHRAGGQFDLLRTGR